VPGLSWEITRPNAIHLVGFDLDGKEISVETDEFEGRIFQHEMDHLNGVLLIERLDADQRRAAKKLLREQRMKIGANDPDGLHRLLGE
jgi:peptide deformylase